MSDYTVDIIAHWLHDYNKVIDQLTNDFTFLAVPSLEEEDSVYCVPPEVMVE